MRWLWRIQSRLGSNPSVSQTWMWKHINDITCGNRINSFGYITHDFSSWCQSRVWSKGYPPIKWKFITLHWLSTSLGVSIWLPPNHPIQTYLDQHYNDMLSFKPVWDGWVPSLRPNLHLVRGVYHCKYVTNVINDFWKRQVYQPNHATIESPYYISSSINMGRLWEPS